MLFRVMAFHEEASRSDSGTQRPVGLLCMNDQPDADTSTRQHTKIEGNKHPWPPLAEFEPTMSASEQLQAHALDRAATGIREVYIRISKTLNKLKCRTGLIRGKPPFGFSPSPRKVHLYAWSHFQIQEEEMRPVCLTISSVLMSEIFVVVFKFLQTSSTGFIYTQ